jgi:hypothetical protein
MLRQCGSCNKCCEGHISGSARDIDFFPGKPCSFLDNNLCSIYLDKPIGCSNYKCAWLENSLVPDWLKPENLNIIVDFYQEPIVVKHKKYVFLKYLRIIEAGFELDYLTLTKIFTYAKENSFNVLWKKENVIYWDGSEEFCNNLEYKYKIKKPEILPW